MRYRAGREPGETTGALSSLSNTATVSGNVPSRRPIQFYS